MARRGRASSGRAVRVQVCVQVLRLRCRPAPLPAPAAPSLAAPSLAALAAACGAARLDALRLEALVAVARPFGLDHHCPLLGARNRDRYARGDGGGAGRGGAGGEADLQRAAVEGDAVVLLDGLEGVCLFGVDDKREALGAAVVLCLQLDSLALANLLEELREVVLRHVEVQVPDAQLCASGERLRRRRRDRARRAALPRLDQRRGAAAARHALQRRCRHAAAAAPAPDLANGLGRAAAAAAAAALAPLASALLLRGLDDLVKGHRHGRHERGLGQAQRQQG
mmetsp:Transcript_11492/g.37570  ORF Transcript_11492/g.37570 Transcript_11492/m.37570 type:complete len:282 (-) Transcript_11492:21-866(-)